MLGTPVADARALRHRATTSGISMTTSHDTAPNHATPGELQTAEFEARLGSFSTRLNLRMTPNGLLAVGGLVGCILLSVAAVVWTATSVRRKHPLLTSLRH